MTVFPKWEEPNKCTCTGVVHRWRFPNLAKPNTYKERALVALENFGCPMPDIGASSPNEVKGQCSTYTGEWGKLVHAPSGGFQI
jgi:hypothetical protein